MIKTVIIGAAGRMGRRLVANVVAAEDMELFGAVEMATSPFIGQDAGVIAGCGEVGVAITADVDGALSGAQAVINFGTANVLEITRKAIAAKAVTVIGTTALSGEEKEELQQLAAAGAKIVFASNMSVGVNLLFSLVGQVAKMLDENYDIEVIEMHHNQKKDAPSGTAVTLAEVICNARGWDYEKDVRHGREGMPGARTKREIGMHSLRGGDVVGDHTVIFAANGERLELTHKASSRDTFVSGALRAVRFLMSDAKGGKLYDMRDVLNLK